MNNENSQESNRIKEAMWDRIVAFSQAIPRFAFPGDPAYVIVLSVNIGIKKDYFLEDPEKWFQSYRKLLHEIADFKADEMEQWAGSLRTVEQK